MPAPGPTALIDAVDDRNEPLTVVPREEVFSRRANFRTVHVLVFNAVGEVLLQQLSPQRERHPGRWGSSVAGYLFAGESYVDAAHRRLSEELGVTTTVAEAGVLRMTDEGVTKFVGIFTTEADHPRNALPDHIAQLAFRSVDEVRAKLVSSPDEFTASFREVFHLVEEARGGRASAR